MGPVAATYENGALLPAKPLPLRQGARVMVVVVLQADPTRWDLARLGASASEDEALSQAGLDEWAADLDREDRA
jgi:predicted DNA-binding antitoxin AbrB/MazE fold protein